MKELMQSEHFIVLLKLIAAHIIANFFFQKKLWAEEKIRNIWSSRWLYLHSFQAAILLYVFVWNWPSWWILPLIFVSHIIVDGLTVKMGDKLSFFVLDQFCHLLIIVITWLVISKLDVANVNHFITAILKNNRFWICLVAYALVLWPAGFLIGKITEPWRNDIEQVFSNGLKKAGLWIGCLERVLVLTFILIHHYEAIGFLLAAKSILRYGELNKSEEKKIKMADIQKKTEYILIGTMLSFLSGTAIGLLASWILSY